MCWQQSKMTPVEKSLLSLLPCCQSLQLINNKHLAMATTSCFRMVPFAASGFMQRFRIKVNSLSAFRHTAADSGK
jgi:hypothetical protein